MTIANIMGWPAPKYGFGQKVRLLPHKGNEEIGVAIIVGMIYRSPIRALKEREDSHGWVYTISIVDAMPVSELVSYDGQEIVTCPEDHLEDIPI